MAKVVAAPVLALALFVAGSALQINEDSNGTWPFLAAVEEEQFKTLYGQEPGVQGYHTGEDSRIARTDECKKYLRTAGPQRRDLTWSEKAAIYGYSGSDYESLNDCLRGLHTVTSPWCYGQYSLYVRTLNKALHQLPIPVQKKLFRYDEHYVPPYMRQGCIFRERSFLSTTKNYLLVFRNKYQYTINLNEYSRGKEITCFSKNYEEEEILWPSNSLFFVTEVSGTQEDGMKITMEPLSPDHDRSKGFCDEETPPSFEAVWAPSNNLKVAFAEAQRKAEERSLEMEDASDTGSGLAGKSTVLTPDTGPGRASQKTVSTPDTVSEEAPEKEMPKGVQDADAKARKRAEIQAKIAARKAARV